MAAVYKFSMVTGEWERISDYHKPNVAHFLFRLLDQTYTEQYFTVRYTRLGLHSITRKG